MTTAICGILGGGPDAGHALDVMLDARWPIMDRNTPRGRPAPYGSEAGTHGPGTPALGHRPMPSTGTPAWCWGHGTPASTTAGRCALRCPALRRVTISDGDLVLRAYLRWGRDCPRRLPGDYAFAVWDARQRILFCARDHSCVEYRDMHRLGAPWAGQTGTRYPIDRAGSQSAYAATSDAEHRNRASSPTSQLSLYMVSPILTCPGSTFRFSVSAFDMHLSSEGGNQAISWPRSALSAQDPHQFSCL